MQQLGLRGVWRVFLPPIGDLGLLYLGLSASFLFRQSVLLTWGTALSFAPLFLIWLAVFYAIGLYEPRQMRDFVSLVGSLILSMAAAFFVGTAYFYVLSPYIVLTPKTHLVLIVGLSHAGMLLWRRLWLELVKFRLLDQKLVILADETHVLALAEDPRYASELGFSPVKWQWPGVDMVVADSRWVEEHWGQAKEILRPAIEHRVPIISLESFYESLYGKVSPDYASGPSWVLEFVLPKSNSFYSKAKRAFDVLFSAVLLAALLPVMILIYVAIAAIDRMPPLFGQKRVGFGGKEFVLWKFRTMVLEAEKDGPFTSAREIDPRVTRLGAYLRRFRLDELPQLWNVLRGDMSLVGPRPEWIEEVAILEKRVSHYHLRHLVPPGITGWAQVYFRATNNAHDSLEKHHYDLYYLKYFSLALDITILLKTIKRVFVRDTRVMARPMVPVKPPEIKVAWASDFSSIIGRN